jgi:ferrous iron transport protein A
MNRAVAANAAEGELLSLDRLLPGQWGQVVQLTTTGSMRRRLLDLGLIAGTAVECLGRSPGGDPSAYRIRGTVIALRACDSCTILVRRMGRCAP